MQRTLHIIKLFTSTIVVSYWPIVAQTKYVCDHLIGKQRKQQYLLSTTIYYYHTCTFFTIWSRFSYSASRVARASASCFVFDYSKVYALCCYNATSSYSVLAYRDDKNISIAMSIIVHYLNTLNLQALEQ